MINNQPVLLRIEYKAGKKSKFVKKSQGLLNRGAAEMGGVGQSNESAIQSIVVSLMVRPLFQFHWMN